MNTELQQEDSLFIGIDGGGSKCKATLANAQMELLGQAIAGPANPLHGVDRALNSIVESAEQALAASGKQNVQLSDLIAGVGLAGLNLPSLYKTVSEWNHPFRKMFLTTDLHIACLGAHGGGEGAVMVIGTGSCGYRFTRDGSIIYGAHGFPFGDKGSGAWLGLEAMRAVLLAADGLGPATLLAELFAQSLSARNLELVEKMAGSLPCDYARLAPQVMFAAEQGDEVAVAIVQDGAEYLSNIADKLLSQGPLRFSLLGGLSEKMLTWMDQRVVDQVSAPLAQPEIGGLYYAQKEYKFWRGIANAASS